MEGIIGRKVGMTQLFLPDGRVESVTVIEAGPCVVTQVRTPERDGYTAIQLGFGAAKRLTKPERGHLKDLGNFRILREFRLDKPGARPPQGQYQVGQQISAGLFQPGEVVDVVGTSKGRGFQGGVRRHGFRGGPKTHGQSDRHRAPGSIGSGTTPGRVLKGTRMAGHLGAERVTVRNLTVVRTDPERNVLMVRGAVPGPRNGLLLVQRAKYQRK
ncbi:MAG: 50S ribosomal protein L3 [Chloroflexi bacterium]|nr:50S ribosomal protein L3 [Chloroflexota bacterium]